MIDIERKALIAEIERFKEEAMEIKVVQVLADSYENGGLFDHSISDDNKVSWVKVQAWQLWGFWKASVVPDGFVLVPKEPTAVMLKAADKHIMDRSATPESCYTAMIEARGEK